MLVNATEMLLKARDGHYGVPQFNINNLEWTKAVLTACEEMGSSFPRRRSGQPWSTPDY